MRRSLPMRAELLAVALVASGALSGCFAPTPTPTPVPTPVPSPTPTPRAILIITSPEDGMVVREPSVQVRGTAPPGAEIVLAISLFGDRRTSADDEGNWVLTVDLEEGPNDFAFRIGDDDSTTKALRVVYEPP
jgi:hypothetical protein